VFISPQISKKKNKTAITTRSHALSLKAQGAIKTSPSPWSAAPIGKWSRTSKLWERIKRKLAKYLKKTNCQLLEFILFILSHSLLVLDHLPIGAALHGLGEVFIAPWAFSERAWDLVVIAVLFFFFDIWGLINTPWN